MSYAVRVSDLTKAYAHGAEPIRVLDGLSVELAEGTVTALTGPSGGGKSTLLNLIAGFDKPDSGHITVGDLEVTAASATEMDIVRTRIIGFIFQQFYLIPQLTALQNVELALFPALTNRAERRRRAKGALQSMGLASHMHRRPAQLSGGQQQRIAVARALVGAPTVVLADEPTAALDRVTASTLLDQLVTQARASSAAVLIATHDPYSMERADRVLTMTNGRISG